MRAGQSLLAQLGRRLRRLRERAGLSLSELARRAGLSRRYVTELEAGRANPSFLKLADLARALRTHPAELVELGGSAEREGRVALVGLRGAGKSSVGRRLALLLEVPFVELDARVEELAGMSLGEIFALHGEATYRRLEREALEQVLADGGRLVIATGGSIATSRETFDRLRETCRTLWLVASPEEHLARVLAQGDRRPIEGHPRAMEELRALLDERRDAYAACDHTLVTSGRSVEEVTREALVLVSEDAVERRSGTA